MPSQNTKDSYQSCERVERLVALGERLVALGDVDVVAIKDVDGPSTFALHFQLPSQTVNSSPFQCVAKMQR